MRTNFTSLKSSIGQQYNRATKSLGHLSGRVISYVKNLPTDAQNDKRLAIGSLVAFNFIILDIEFWALRFFLKVSSEKEFSYSSKDVALANFAGFAFTVINVVSSLAIAKKANLPLTSLTVASISIFSLACKFLLTNLLKS